jgi:hypothetical protein
MLPTAAAVGLVLGIVAEKHNVTLYPDTEISSEPRRVWRQFKTTMIPFEVVRTKKRNIVRSSQFSDVFNVRP